MHIKLYNRERSLENIHLKTQQEACYSYSYIHIYDQCLERKNVFENAIEKKFAFLNCTPLYFK